MIIFVNNFSKADNTSNMNLTSLPVQSRQSAYVFLVLSSMLAVLIITGNSLVIAAYRKNTRLQTRTNVFIVSLAVSDLLVGGISVPIWTYLTFVNYEQDLDGFFEFFISFDRFSALASIFHLTAISLERYMAISRPFDHGMLSFRFYKYMVITAWITAGAMTILSVFSKLFAFHCRQHCHRVYIRIPITGSFNADRVRKDLQNSASPYRQNPQYPNGGIDTKSGTRGAQGRLDSERCYHSISAGLVTFFCHVHAWAILYALFSRR